MAQNLLSLCAAEVKQRDYQRYLATLFAPAELRKGFFALIAFHAEIARIEHATREPMMAAIRYAWWREAVEELYAGKTPRKHPVVETLSSLVQSNGLSRKYFDSIIDGYEERADAGEGYNTEQFAQKTAGALLTLQAELFWSSPYSLLPITSLDPGLRRDDEKKKLSQMAETIGINYALKKYSTTSILLKSMPKWLRVYDAQTRYFSNEKRQNQSSESQRLGLIWKMWQA